MDNVSLVTLLRELSAICVQILEVQAQKLYILLAYTVQSFPVGHCGEDPRDGVHHNTFEEEVLKLFVLGSTLKQPTVHL